MRKIFNGIIGSILKVLLKIYKRPNNPMLLETDVGKVITNFPEEGGVESFIPGHPYPFPGLPDSKNVDLLSTVKKMLPVACKYAWVSMNGKFPDPQKYSRPVREIYRVLKLIREKYGNDPSVIDDKGMWTEIRDIICFALEFDDFYRFVFMDMLSEINMEEMEFTDADKYWAAKKWQYQFKFKNQDNTKK